MHGAFFLNDPQKMVHRSTDRKAVTHRVSMVNIYTQVID